MGLWRTNFFPYNFLQCLINATNRKTAAIVCDAADLRFICHDIKSYTTRPSRRVSCFLLRCQLCFCTTFLLKRHAHCECQDAFWH